MFAIQSTSPARRTRQIIAFFLAALSLSSGAIASLHPKDEWPLTSIRLKLFFGLHPGQVLPNPAIQTAPNSSALLAKLARSLASSEDPRFQHAAVLVTEEHLRVFEETLQSRASTPAHQDGKLRSQLPLFLWLDPARTSFARACSARNLGHLIALRGSLGEFEKIIRLLLFRSGDLYLVIPFFEGLRAHSTEGQSLSDALEDALINSWDEKSASDFKSAILELQMLHRDHLTLCATDCPIPLSHPVCFLNHLDSQAKSPHKLLRHIRAKISQPPDHPENTHSCNFCSQRCREEPGSVESRLHRIELLTSVANGRRIPGTRGHGDAVLGAGDIFGALLFITTIVFMCWQISGFLLKLVMEHPEPSAPLSMQRPSIKPGHWNMGGPALF